MIVRRNLVVGQPGTDGGAPPTPPDQHQGSGSSAESSAPAVSTPPTAPARLAMVPFGRRLLLAGPIVLTDGVPRGTRPAAGRTAPGLNLRRRTLILGRLFASRAARVQATATATARDTGGRVGRSHGHARPHHPHAATNTSRALRLRVPASVILRVRGAKRLSVTNPARRYRARPQDRVGATARKDRSGAPVTHPTRCARAERMARVADSPLRLPMRLNALASSAILARRGAPVAWLRAS
ncbi:MAG TPA: hypothetical protein VFY45_13025, partial [Baekduia sp.]|nr:hypothetical protein [Baekduia sp.]